MSARDDYKRRKVLRDLRRHTLPLSLSVAVWVGIAVGYWAAA